MTKEELRQAYLSIPTGNISDAMDRLKLPRGVMIDGPNPISYTQPRLAGFACTIQQMPRHQSETEAKLTSHLKVYNEIAQPGDVVLIDVGGRKDVCSGGGMSILRLKQRGIGGLIVNGCFRDIADVIRAEFPLFCTGVTPIKSVPFLQTTGVNVPITIGGVQVRPGDLVVGDDSGIVVVPIEKAEEVLAVAREINLTEYYMTQYIEEGIDYMECRRLAEEKVKGGK